MIVFIIESIVIAFNETPVYVQIFWLMYVGKLDEKSRRGMNDIPELGKGRAETKCVKNIHGNFIVLYNIYFI